MTLSKTLIGSAIIGALALVAIVTFSSFASAAVGPVVTPTIQNGSNAAITSALVGTQLHVSAMVASSSTTTVPTGTVDFNQYAGTSCSGVPSTQTGVALVNGSAQSATTTLLAGGLSYVVHYPGDTNFNPSDSACVNVSATQYTPTVATALSSSGVLAGSSVYDTSTLSNATSTAGGSVHYNVYSNNTCSALALNAGSQAVTNATVPNSASWQFITPGTYYWQAVYSGDANNAAATSTCGSEILTVTATSTTFSPTMSTTLSSSSVTAGSSVYDTSALASASSTAGGSVSYKVYTNNVCTTGMLDAGSKTVTNASVPNSNSLVFNTPGTYYWQAVYSGDATNAAATSSCSSEVLTVGATTTPPIGGVDTISGNVFNDQNGNDTKDSSEPGLAGWTIWLHGANTASSTPWWKGGWFQSHDGYNDPIVATATTDANGNYSFGNLGSGQYFVEESVMSGWNQTSSDMKVVLDSTHTSAIVNFANMLIASTTGNGHGDGNNGGGNGNGDGDHGQDNATSTNHGGTGTTTIDKGNWNNGNSDTNSNGNGKGNDNQGDTNENNGNGRGNGASNNGNSGWGGVISHVTNFFHGNSSGKGNRGN